jgi:hypothetical protein
MGHGISADGNRQPAASFRDARLVLVVPAFMRSLAGIGLPPGVASPQDEARWVNLTNGDRITGIGSHSDTIWAATKGGLVGLDKVTGAPCDWTPTHIPNPRTKAEARQWEQRHIDAAASETRKFVLDWLGHH